MKAHKRMNQRGVTLIEILVAITIATLVIGSVTMTFKSQHDSSIVQEQVTAMQQNLRAAMYMLTRDIQMAGYYTNFDNVPRALNWDDLDGDNETITPRIYGRNNINVGGDQIRDNSDVIVIIKASEQGRPLTGAEGTPTSNTISLNTLDLDGDGNADLNTGTKKYGILVKANMARSEFFEITGVGANISINGTLIQTYEAGDLIFRADVIIYRIDEDAANPGLRRKNLGDDNGYRLVAENIDQLQFRYLLSNGNWVDDPAGSENLVRAVEVFLLARTAHTIRNYTNVNTYVMGDGGYHAGAPAPNNNPPNDQFRRKLLSCIVKTRNIGIGL